MSDVAVTVLGIIRRKQEYLVQRLTDPGGETFHRPIGGGIEFGETSGTALEREFREELGLTVSVGRTVGTLENRFTWDGTPAHEVVVLREAEFADTAVYERDRFDGIDAGGAVEYEATWRSLDDLARAAEPLYPTGLVQLLRGDGGTGNGHLVDP